MTNPKSEIRNPKQIQSSKFETSTDAGRSGLECRPVRCAQTGGDSSPLWFSATQSAAQAAHAKRFAFFYAFLVSAFCFPLFAFAQYSLDWWTVDGGGGTSTGGVFSVSGTIGQPDAGAMSGGPFTLVGGFWSVIAAVQTPGAPYLTVFRTATNTVVVSWPLAGSEGWVLQATNALPQVAAPWPQIPPPYQTNAGNLQFIESTPTGNKFYRLHKP